jgi:hypothetical protein
MVNKFCKGCNSMRPAKKFCKETCAICYERIRSNSILSQLFTCIQCGPVLCRKLINSHCNKCYTKIYRAKKSSLKICPSCNLEKKFSTTICRGCETFKWRLKNPGKNVAYVAKRRASKANATPIWSDLKLIDEFYKKCPKGMEVDHIIPINSDKVCGLHIVGNLQYLSKKENAHKNNQFDGTLNNDSWRIYVGG